MGQMIEFNLILKAAKAPISAMGFWKLLVGTVLMLAFGYAGETGAIGMGLTGKWIGFVCGMLGWVFILFEIFAGESGNACATWCVRRCQAVVQQHALDCFSWVGYLSIGIRPWLSHGFSRWDGPQCSIQHC